MRTIWRSAKVTVVAALVLLLTTVIACFGYRGYRHSVIARATAETSISKLKSDCFLRDVPGLFRLLPAVAM